MSENNKKINLKIRTKHGNIDLPAFLPDATRGLVKLISGSELKKIRVGPMVVNTLHLYLQPGLKVIKKAARLLPKTRDLARQGGIHKFMNWDSPLLSDSGGFQVFSLIHKNPKMGKIFDNGVMFKSPIDGSKHMLTPEKSIQIQFELGTDMMVCLDDCPPNESDSKDLKKSVERTIGWAKKCRLEFDRQVRKRKIKDSQRPLLFSVIQGGADLDLRKKCIEGLMEVSPDAGWDGYGFGARPVDEKGNFLSEVLKYTADLIPAGSLKFALGIGTPEDIVRCAAMGWEMFDCVIPTREGRHGRIFTSPQPLSLLRRGELKGRGFYNSINITNSRFAKDFSPINKDSRLPELREYSKAYLHHLFKIREPLGQRLASLNNLEFYIDLMEKIRRNVNS